MQINRTGNQPSFNANVTASYVKKGIEKANDKVIVKNIKATPSQDAKLLEFFKENRLSLAHEFSFACSNGEKALEKIKILDGILKKNFLKFYEKSGLKQILISDVAENYKNAANDEFLVSINFDSIPSAFVSKKRNKL